MTARVRAVVIEGRREALGIGERNPRLSWQIDAAAGWRQRAYEVQLASTRVGERSVAVASEESVLVPWPGVPLASRERVAVTVRVSGHDEAWSEWSDRVVVEAGLFEASDWIARPVGGSWPEVADSDRRPARVRTEFVVRPDLREARLYVSAHGLFEVEINGERVGADALAPGWSSYDHRLRYLTYDIRDMLAEGPNAIGAWLADGWYRGRIGFAGGTRNLWGDDLGLIAQMELRYRDGTSETVVTDDRWRARESPILFSGIYDGEIHDARADEPGWSRAGFDDADWTSVAVGHRDPATLRAYDAPPVRAQEDIAPVELVTSPSGHAIYDFGQNLVGRIRLRLSGSAGSVVRLRHAEILQEGDLYTRPLRDARATDEYILRGDGPEEWEPRFTFHGFRYAELTIDGDVHEVDLVARVYHSDMSRTGWFSSSDPLLNQLHENIVWSMRGNFVDVPTDCPQRDERLGWTADLQVFAPSACYLYGCGPVIANWLRDLAVEQQPDGNVPWYVPWVPTVAPWAPLRPGAGWGDAAVLVPWTMFERFGDREVLRRQFPSARAWVDLMARLAGPSRLWDSGRQIGDWLDPTAPPEDPSATASDGHLIATAYFARSTAVLAHMARELGLTDDARRYGELAAEVRSAFRGRYVLGGRLTDDAQTSYALAIRFDLLDEPDRQAAGDRLAALVHDAGNRLATGFLGTAAIADALQETGHVDTAWKLLLERECPSWLYPVTRGATTAWERWDSLREDGTVNPGSMTSFNHYALGAVADWMHRAIVGIAPAAPGYRAVAIRPQPGGGLTWASGRHDSSYGTITSAWRVEGDSFLLDVELPVGVSGTAYLPDGDEVILGPGRHHLVGRTLATATRRGANRVASDHTIAQR